MSHPLIWPRGLYTSPQGFNKSQKLDKISLRATLERCYHTCSRDKAPKHILKFSHKEIPELTNISVSHSYLLAGVVYTILLSLNLNCETSNLQIVNTGFVCGLIILFIYFFYFLKSLRALSKDALFSE